MARFPRYAPEFTILLDGEPMPTAMRAAISSLQYQDGMEGADRVEVTLANPSLRWLDHPLLSVDRGFKLKIGYAPDPLQEVFVGEITGIEPTFPANGMPTIKIVAQDFLHRMTQGTKDRAFRISIPSVGNFPLPDAAVAAIVSGTNALIPGLDPIGGALSVIVTLVTFLAFPQFAQLAVRKQESQTDFEFLTEIAKANGWSMFIDHTVEPRGYVLRFQFLIQDYSPDLALRWGQSLTEFTPRITTVGDIAGVTARVWVDSIKTEFMIAVSWDYDRAAFNLQIFPSFIGDADKILGPEGEGKTISLKPTGFAAAPQNILKELLPRLNNRLTGSGSTVGDPRIKASKVIQLDGLGSQFSGLYRVTQATHTIDGSGYKTSFQARKEVWFGSIPTPKGASGLLRLQGQFSV
jgi:uncharacterized protein